MNVLIREASNDDEENFVRLSLALSVFNRNHHPQTDCFDEVLHARAGRAVGMLRSRNLNQLILIAVIGAECVGYALANVLYPDPTSDNGTELCGLLDELYIDDTVRGNGLGKRLMFACFDWMKRKGARKVKLHMYQWNDHARRLYEKAGFVSYAVSFEKNLD